MKKKVLSWLLALVMAIMPLSAGAEGEWVEMITGPVDAVPVETENAEPEDRDEWWNILLLGCDSYSKNEYSRTDSMIILSVNSGTDEMKMTSLMRDTWVTVPGKKTHRKLTELCAVGGPELTVQAINEHFDMDIKDYVLISMEGIAEIIDLLGGVELDVTEAERKALNKGLFDLSPYSGMEKLEKSGENVHLNGNQATAYARIRNIDSDFVRTERQRVVLMAMAKKLKDGANLFNILGIVSSLMDFVDTNLGLTELMKLGNQGLRMDLSSIQELRLPADGTYDSGTFDGVWCIKPDFKKNTSILHDFIYG